MMVRYSFQNPFLQAKPLQDAKEKNNEKQRTEEERPYLS
jgi:hypothetical protein